MKAAIVRTTIDRKTGRQISEEIIGYEEIDEDTFYRPLVEIFGRRALQALQDNKQECLEESGDRGAIGDEAG